MFSSLSSAYIEYAAIIWIKPIYVCSNIHEILLFFSKLTSICRGHFIGNSFWYQRSVFSGHLCSLGAVQLAKWTESGIYKKLDKFYWVKPLNLNKSKWKIQSVFLLFRAVVRRKKNLFSRIVSSLHSYFTSMALKEIKWKTFM